MRLPLRPVAIATLTSIGLFLPIVLSFVFLPYAPLGFAVYLLYFVYLLLCSFFYLLSCRQSFYLVLFLLTLQNYNAITVRQCFVVYFCDKSVRY